MKKLESALKYTRIALCASFLLATILITLKIQSPIMVVFYSTTIVLFIAQLILVSKLKKQELQNENITD